MKRMAIGASGPQISKLISMDRLPLVQDSRSRERSPFPNPEHSLLIYDGVLAKISREFRAWSMRYHLRYEVKSGESLKDVRRFPRHLEKLTELSRELAPREMVVVAAGGGSVGDFAGFFASVFRRGVRLVHIPTTWLAAIDSSHGGKTALNAGNVKNVVGTFYPAEKVLLVQSLFLVQPDERIMDAMGELGKIALIDGGLWVHRLERTRLRDGDLLWSFLKPAIQAKLKIVTQDPYESNGLRQTLGLGHTIGHVLESAYRWSHGHAVGQGLFFDLEFSEKKGLLSMTDKERAMKLLTGKLGLKPERPPRKMAAHRFRELVLRDRRKTGRHGITYVFLRQIGRVERDVVPVNEIVKEARRQGWIEKE